MRIGPHSSYLHEEPSVDAELGPRNVVAVLGTEIDAGSGYFLGSSKALHGDLLEQFHAYLFGYGHHHLGLGEARRYAIHGDPLGDQFLGQRLAERGQAGLGGGIVRLTKVADLPDDRRTM